MLNRRVFCTLAVAPAVMSPAHATDTQTLNYGHSFVGHVGGPNEVRFAIESMTTITANGASHPFYVCSSCKAEHLYGDRDLFQADNFDFTPIVGERDYLFFRRYAAADAEKYRQILPENWGERRFLLGYRPVDRLSSFDDIYSATQEGRQIVARTTLEGNGTRAVIEYPVKTMNLNVSDELWQTDTGPIALPDLTRAFDKSIASLSLAYAAFNAGHFTDFIVETVVDLGRAKVHHYSERMQLAASNELFAMRP